MRRDASSPEAYRNAVDGALRDVLEAIRGLVFEVAPDVHETIGHGMLDYPGLANLAAQKQYVSLYVAASVLERHRAAFGGHCGKSCVRFGRIDEVDPDAVRTLLRDVLTTRRSQP